MSNRVQDYGMDVSISRKLNSRYDSQSEMEVIGWFKHLMGEDIHPGRENVQHSLRNGFALIKLVNAVYDGTPNLPPAAQHIRRPIAANKSNTPFKQMENIQVFLNAAEAYGVPKTSLFQTVDLYESRNMAQVMSTLLQLGTECQRCGFRGPVIGPKPTYENRRGFDEMTMRSGEGIISLQAGTNKLASQKGMSMGSVRHVADIRCDVMTAEGAAVIGLQMGTNTCASQKGMSMGTVRHIADLRCDNMSQGSQGVIGLQMGTNQCASQKGMSIGSFRHVSDIRCDNMTQESQGVIGLQAGTNQLASQKGMATFGAVRHVADIRCDNLSRKGGADISLQMGPNPNTVATQSGMSFGAPRQIVETH